MPTGVSKVLVALEIILIGVVTMPYQLILTIAAAAGSTKSAVGFWTFVMVLAVTLFVLTAYRVAFAFLIDGAAALRNLHRAWWWLSIGGAIYAILASLYAPLTGSMYIMGDNFKFAVTVTGLFGLLYLVPLAHMLLELRFRKAGAHAA